jgi:Lrp/AsnC family transcriptional regulator, regulator of ectoine-degradation genes
MSVGGQIVRLVGNYRRGIVSVASRAIRKIDTLDIKILCFLQQNGRMQKHLLAEAVNLSASPCADRIRRLEQAGVITGYRAEIDVSRFLPLTYVTILVSLENHRAHDFKRFEAAVLEAEEIVHCEALVGDVDYVLQFVGRSLEHYQHFMEALLEANVGVQRYAGYVRSKTIKHEAAFPVARAVAWRDANT